MSGSESTNFVRLLHLSFGFFDDTMPPKIAKHVQTLKSENPGWTVITWGPTESRALVAAVAPQVLDLYDGYPYAIQRSDLSRYVILFAHGGVYADLDYMFMAPLDQVVEAAFGDDANAFVNATPNATAFRKRASNSLMGARAPAHPFWTQVLSAVNKGWGLSKHQIILSSAGPQAVDRALRAWRKAHSGAMADVRLLPTAVFNPCGICNRHSLGTAFSDGVLAVHGNDGSWHSPTSAMYNTVFCDWGYYVAITALLVIAITFIVLFAQLSQQSP